MDATQARAVRAAAAEMDAAHAPSARRQAAAGRAS
jgi:hypothetical protein